MFDDRKNTNAALNDLRAVFLLLDLELTPKLEAKFVALFKVKYNQVKNKIAVKERFKRTEQAKIDFINWIERLLDQAIAFANEFKNEESIDQRVEKLSYSFGLLLGAIQYGVSSPMMVQWKYSGDSIPLVEGIENKFDAIMVELQRINKDIILESISKRANYLSSRRKAKRSDFGLAYRTLVKIAGALRTKDLG